MEAIIGAVYLDGGFDAVREMVLGLFRDVIRDKRHGKYIITDYKTALQEKLQSHKITDIKYVLTGESGAQDWTRHSKWSSLSMAGIRRQAQAKARNRLNRMPPG